MASLLQRTHRLRAPRPILLAGVLAACAGQPAFAPPALAQADDGCRSPFVWREAFPGDHVCVVPRTRSRAAADNAVADARVNPTNHDYGPDTCRYGYVWREARRSDHVCVVPEIRAEAARDNADAVNRTQASLLARQPARVQQAGCCPQSLLVCLPAGRPWCR